MAASAVSSLHSICLITTPPSSSSCLSKSSKTLSRSPFLYSDSFSSLKNPTPLFNLHFKKKLTTHKPHSLPLVFAAQTNFFKVIQTTWKVASDGVKAGTNMVPASVPRPVAKVSVAIVGLTVSLFVIKSFLSTAFFVLATMGLVYFTFIALYKDEGPKGNDDNMTTTKDTPTSTEDSLEEARSIMEKYK
ncbi:uncharacterized protein LOC115714169 [Cannabis sativa]|uniref:uncharacterized protein LOC115714169 n=1 Tax=Cannabis sativa TaxID=3483 RepID=UPI0029C9FC04|nr:uncharacterized protein LOC115714169 [Cannabis sativa]